ncbi:galactosyltransferase-related protein [Flavimaricola marinus]|uniref:Glycosyl transferase family 2 n=1 Tax=Flavimaricola marinus TaxID=1819565 RepID=A0A238LIK2_9RHOB|nr:galactosyltransferase-related protein [Flavimaricola marinus]SMY09234.1 hypothetical protein LOM8899_03399 [Flavimaricola marinus]
MTDPRHIRAQLSPPVDLHDGFEVDFQAAQRLFSDGKADQAEAIVTRLRTGLTRIGPDLAADRAARLDALRPHPITAPMRGQSTLPPGLDADQPALPGVSVVTASRNRTENLLQALRSWLAAPEVCEVVIVDWSSDIPVSDSLATAGLADPRIRVARVEDEPAWVLTWAFNLGFRLARHGRILKADADIRLAPDFFETNSLHSGQVISGNWRTAPQGQEYINGVFYTHRADLAAVQGFNEHITRYGWDDDELYDRLIRAGVARVDLAPGSVAHIDHDDTARLSAVPEALATGWTDLRALPMYGIRTNRLIATLMPDWTPARRMQPFADADGILRRSGPLPHPVPAPMQRTAERLAGREMLSWQAGPRVFELEDEALDLLLTVRRLGGTTALHVALMLARAPLDAVVADRHLVVDLDLAALQARPETATALKQSLVSAASGTGRHLVLRGHDAPGHTFGGLFEDLVHLPAHTTLGPAPEVSLQDADHDAASPVLRLTAGLDLLRQFDSGPDRGTVPTAPLLLAPNTAFPTTGPLAETKAPPRPPSPAVIPGGARRLYIDARHGLGNRLRAIGSAAAVARATGRKMIVVWEPDQHCEARLSDLYRYDGPLLEQSGAPDGATRISYMEMEDGAVKDAPLSLPEGRDVYVRSAYVLNHPASHWGPDVAFLRALQPSPQVMALVRGHSRSRPRPDIGIHIRMQGAPGTALQSYDSPENWTADSHAAIQHWREQSHHDRFIARTRAVFDTMPDARAFLAADTAESYAAFEAAFGDRVSRLERPLFDRSAEQLQYALADVLLLARAQHFLGSPWSSFSELVLRLSTTIETQEKAGTDF